jgi:hypothetical protein
MLRRGEGQSGGRYGDEEGESTYDSIPDRLRGTTFPEDSFCEDTSALTRSAFEVCAVVW